jgi:hypothetical protein
MDDGDETPIFGQQLSRLTMKMTYNKYCCLRMERFLIDYHGIFMVMILIIILNDDKMTAETAVICSALVSAPAGHHHAAGAGASPLLLHHFKTGRTRITMTEDMKSQTSELDDSRNPALLPRPAPPPATAHMEATSAAISPASSSIQLLLLEQQQDNGTNRRVFLVQHATAAAAATTAAAVVACSTFPLRATAANLPKSTGADLSATGSIETLIPIVRLLESLQTIKKQLVVKNASSSSSSLRQVLMDIEKLDARNNVVIPMDDEKSFKRIFDAYSQPVSYKQKFMDQNAFLVYYTQGYDGPNRPRLEEDEHKQQDESNDQKFFSAQQQTLQYGFRNDAWTAWNDFLTELEFAVKQTGGLSSTRSLNQDAMLADLLEPLNRTIDAVSAYMSLAPEPDVKQAYQQAGTADTTG